MPNFRTKILNYKMGRFGLYFGNFSAVRVQNGPKTWSSVVYTYRIDILSAVRDFEPSRRRTNFFGGLLLACLLACNDLLVRRTLTIITRRDGRVPVKVLLPSSFFLLPSSFFLLPERACACTCVHVHECISIIVPLSYCCASVCGVVCACVCACTCTQ